MRQIVWFDDVTADDRGLVGGKNAALGAMTAAGLAVPPGFALTTRAFEECLRHSNWLEQAWAEVDGVDVRDLTALAAAADRARRTITDAELTAAVRDALAAAYGELCERTGEADVPVAVRSSSVNEDLAAASCAGQQDSFLWIRGVEGLTDAVRRCWASLFNDRAVAYRAEQGHATAHPALAVGVQQMVRPKAAGVAFTLDPSNGDRSKVVIESVFGFGEGVASGAVTPDHFVVDKVVTEIVHRRVSAKEREFVLDEPTATVVERPLDADRAGQSSLDDDEIRAIVEACRRVEAHFGCPQDVEWAIAGPAGEDGPPLVVLLQARPETVWSNKPRRRISSGPGGLTDGVLATLLKPVKVGGPG